MANSFNHWRKFRDLSLVYLKGIKGFNLTSYTALEVPIVCVFLWFDSNLAGFFAQLPERVENAALGLGQVKKRLYFHVDCVKCASGGCICSQDTHKEVNDNQMHAHTLT